jgi:hypothetical protein
MLPTRHRLTGLVLLFTLETTLPLYAGGAEHQAIVASKHWGGKVTRCDPQGPDTSLISPMFPGKKITNDTLNDLAGLKRLSTPDIRTTGIADSGLTEFRDFNKPRFLLLTRINVADAGLQDLRALQKLQTPSLKLTKVTPTSMSDPRASLPETQITQHPDVSQASAIAAVEKLGGKVLRRQGSDWVTSVILNGKIVTDANLRDLRDFKHLSELQLTDTMITDNGLKELGVFEGLSSLRLARTRVTAKGIPQLKTLRSLRVLDLSNIDLNNEGVKQLREFTNLRSLALYSTQIDSDALIYLGNLKELVSLDLGGNYGLGDGPQFVDLREFRNLAYLNLAFTGITDASLPAIRILPNLKTLVVGTTLAGSRDITDKGLKQLKGLIGLQTLQLAYTGTTQAGRDELKAALPRLRIVDITGREAPPRILLPKDREPDVRFVFDYSELNLKTVDPKQDATIRASRDSFEKAVRNQVYPILRDITGVYLGKYRKEIRYTIVRNETPLLGGRAGGVTTGGNHIMLKQMWSLGRNPPNDIHEMIHAFNQNTDALHGADDHIWHGALWTAVLARMDWPIINPRERVADELKRLIDKIEMSHGKLAYDVLRGYRCAILSTQLELFYYERGDKAIGRLYRSTINPHPVGKPSKRMVEAWGKEANKVQALLETLKKEYQYSFDERTHNACGF